MTSLPRGWDTAKKYLLPALLLLIVFATLSPSLNNDFINWDDPRLVAENTHIRELSFHNIGRIFTSFYIGCYHPLTILTYAVEYRFFGLNPAVFHATSLNLHLANCLLVFWLIMLMRGGCLAAFAAALLFGIHPLHVESVAWVSERKDVLYAFFFLAALVSHAYYRRENLARYYWLTLALFVLSLLSKVMAITLPLILLLFDRFIFRKAVRAVLREKVPFLAIAAVFAVLGILAQNPDPWQADVIPRFTFLDRVLFPGYVLAFHLAKSVLPLNLSAIYPYPEKIGALLPAAYYISTPAVAILFAALFYLRDRAKAAFFGFSFFFLAILPVIRLIPFPGPSITFDRYNYVASIGLFYAAGMFLSRLYPPGPAGRKWQKLVLAVILAALAGVLAFSARQRCLVWKDSITLWTEH